MNGTSAAHVVAGQMAAEAAYRDIGFVLDSCGIDSIVLKGPHLGAEFYGEASQRGYTDLDLLVRPKQFDDAVSALIGRGYTPIDGLVGRYVRGFDSPQGWPIELHRAFEAYGLFWVDYDALFERARSFEFGTVSAKGLAREDLLLHLVIHAAKSHFREIGRKHIEDIGMVVGRSFRWDWFMNRVQSVRCKSASWVLLSAASSICDADIPRDVLRQLQPSRARRKWLRVWLTQDQFPMFRWQRLPVWIGRLVVLPAIVDRFRDGVSSGIRFAVVRASDVARRHRA